MKSKITKSLRRHNKLNHASVNGVLHMGGGVNKPRTKSPKFKAVNDQPKRMRVPVAEFVQPFTDHGEQ